MPWGAAIAAVGTIAAGKMNSDSTKKAAAKQAEGVENAQKISKEMADQARRDALMLFDPAFSSVFDAAQDSVNLLNTGRENAYSILNKTNKSVGDILRQGSSNYQNALLGRPGGTQSQMQAQRADQIRSETTPVGGQMPVRRILPVGPPQAFADPTQKYQTAGTIPGQESQLRPTSMQGNVTAIGGNPEMVATGMQTESGQRQVPASFLRQMVRSSEDLSFEPGQQQQMLGRLNATPTGVGYTGMNLSDLQKAGNQIYNTPVPASVQTNSLVGNITEQAGQRLDVPGMDPIDVYRNELGTYEAPSGTGLYAAEDSLRQGAAGGISALRQGAAGGLMSLEEGFGRASSAIGTGRSDIRRGVNAATGYLSPYRETGQSALQKEAALSGALGPEAQAQAYAQFQESPGQSFLREQSERALTRNAAATGNIGGGNVSRELQAQAQGLALQDLDRQISNLRSLAGRGQEAANTSGGFQVQGAGMLSNLQSNLANIAAQTGAGKAGVYGNLGSQEASILTGLGKNIAGMQYGTGQQLAQNQQQLTNAMAQLESQTGMNLANMDQQTLMNTINTLMKQGGTQAQLATQLATLLGNIATGQGTQQANLATALGGAQASGVTNPWGNAISQLTGMVATNPGMFGLDGGSTSGQNLHQQTGGFVY